MQQSVILLVDDSADNLQLLINRLGKLDCEVLFAKCGEEALEIAQSEKPDLIMMDIIMPGIDGFETCRQLKLNESTHDIPVVFMTALSNQESKLKGFQVGSVDYVTKPLEHEEVLARVKAHLTIRKQQQALEKIKEQLEKQIELILEQKKILQELARTDPMTKLPNRRDFYDRVSQEHAHYKRTGKPFTIAFSDIDHFKTINDKYGHDYGDVVLKQLADKIKQMLREEDYLARWGGDEFIILLRGTNAPDAQIVIDRIREKLADSNFKHNDVEFTNTATFGACEFNDSLSIDECIKLADKMLLEGKEKGRNNVVIQGH